MQQGYEVVAVRCQPFLFTLNLTLSILSNFGASFSLKFHLVSLHSLKYNIPLMKFFIDTANLEQIEEARDLGILDGVTTNPSLMAKEGITTDNWSSYEVYSRYLWSRSIF